MTKRLVWFAYLLFGLGVALGTLARVEEMCPEAEYDGVDVLFYMVVWPLAAGAFTIHPLEPNCEKWTGE